MPEPAPRFCFLMERHVGIGSAAAALEPYIRQRGHLWCDVTYVKLGGFLERLPIPTRVRGALRGFEQTSTALREGGFDAVCFLTHNPAVFQQKTLSRVPTLLWTDVTPAQLDAQAEAYDHPVDRSHLVSGLKTVLVTRTFRGAAMCVGWSEWARRSLVQDYHVPERQTAVVAPGVDLAHWKFERRENEQGLPRLLFVGGHFVRKGGQQLLRVFREQFRGRCELDLVTRDDVPEEPGVRVHRGLTPDSAELSSLYRNASAFVLPTRADCFSIASLEAMATGLPVIVSAIGGISDIVDHGRSGYLIDPGDDRALGAAIERLLANPGDRLAMGALGRKIVEERFDSEKTAGRLIDLLGSVAVAAPPRVAHSEPSAARLRH